MSKIILIAILFTVCISAQKTLLDFNNKTMIVGLNNMCKQSEYCCFEDTVVMTINYENTKVNSFTFKGKQTGKDCTGEQTVYAVGDIKTTQEISLEMIVENKARKLMYNLITSERGVQVEGQQCSIYNLQLRNDEDSNVDQQLTFSKSADKCESLITLYNLKKAQDEKEQEELERQMSFNHILLLSSLSFILYFIF